MFSLIKLCSCYIISKRSLVAQFIGAIYLQCMPIKIYQEYIGLNIASMNCVIGIVHVFMLDEFCYLLSHSFCYSRQHKVQNWDIYIYVYVYMCIIKQYIICIYAYYMYMYYIFIITLHYYLLLYSLLNVFCQVLKKKSFN